MLLGHKQHSLSCQVSPCMAEISTPLGSHHLALWYDLSILVNGLSSASSVLFQDFKFRQCLVQTDAARAKPTPPPAFVLFPLETIWWGSRDLTQPNYPCQK